MHCWARLSTFNTYSPCGSTCESTFSILTGVGSVSCSNMTRSIGGFGGARVGNKLGRGIWYAAFGMLTGSSGSVTISTDGILLTISTGTLPSSNPVWQLVEIIFTFRPFSKQLRNVSQWNWKSENFEMDFSKWRIRFIWKQNLQCDRYQYPDELTWNVRSTPVVLSCSIWSRLSLIMPQFRSLSFATRL